jgi:hypothetical protein
MTCSCVAILSLVKVRDEVTFFMGFQSEGFEKKLEVLFEKNLSLFEHSFYQHE